MLADTWKRLTFLYTTGERLLAAETLKELTVHDEERDVLWQALLERALQSQQHQVQDLPELPLGPNCWRCLGFWAGKRNRSPEKLDNPFIQKTQFNKSSQD